MKTLKITISILALFLITLSSCKKEKNEPKSEDTTVTAEDLLNYQMFWALLEPDKTISLRVLYFEKVGNEIKATLDGIVSRNIKTIKIENNSLVFDLNENGSVVYTFEFTKKDGKVAIASGKFYNINNPEYTVGGFSIGHISEYPSVKNKTYKYNGDNNQLIKFNADTWLYSDYPNVTGSYYEAGHGCWKGKINGISFMGISLTTSEGVVMGMQKYGEKEPISFVLY